MKNIKFNQNTLGWIAIAIIFLSFVAPQISKGVFITDKGTDHSPHESAVLEVESTERGVLFPRLTTYQRDNIVSPATGLLVFDTDTKSFWYYTNKWTEIINDTQPANSITNAGSGEVITANERNKLNSLSVIPVGTIIPFGGPNIPDGWLLCNGATKNQSQFPELYSAIGISWGSGNNSGGSFNLPDLQGRFLRGRDNGTGNDPDAVDRTKIDGTTKIGDVVGSYQGDEVKRHSHPFVTYWFTADGGGYIRGSNSTGSAGWGNTIETGGSETRPKNAYVNYIIKY